MPPSCVLRERGSGGVQSAGVSQRVRATGRDEFQSVPSPEKLFKTRDFELSLFEGFLWKATKEYLNQRGTKIRVF